MLNEYQITSIKRHTIPQQSNLYSETITVGDMHGSAIKLLYFLQANGIYEFSEQEYNRLIQICLNQNPNEIQLENFKNLIASKEIKNRKHLRFLGDLLADRGENDFLTLLILDDLKKKEVPLTFILGNHDLEAVRFYQMKNREAFQQQFIDDQERSVMNLKVTLRQSNDIKKEYERIFSEIYLKNLKVFDFEDIGTDGLRIFSHTPITLEIIQGVCQKLSIPYDAESLKNREYFKNILRQINEKVLAEINDPDKNIDETLIYNPNSYLYKLFWNRNVKQQDIEEMNELGYMLEVVHGHIGEGAKIKSQGNVFYTNLDRDIGRPYICGGLFATYESTQYSHKEFVKFMMSQTLARFKERCNSNSDSMFKSKKQRMSEALKQNSSDWKIDLAKFIEAAKEMRKFDIRSIFSMQYESQSLKDLTEMIKQASAIRREIADDLGLDKDHAISAQDLITWQEDTLVQSSFKLPLVF